jgi:threonine dehydrogenase-like Zn-dependent dehydrogenase
MKALEWTGPASVRLAVRARPTITDPADAIIQITTTTICGSDLHMYLGEVPAMKKGDIIGHEFMGIVREIGPNVRNIRIGDRVVVSAVIADGTCSFCLKGKYSLCDNTNPSVAMEQQYGHRLAGIFGYSHLTGGFPGGQAEFARVPIADVNCLQVPSHLPDEKVLFLSDIICTGWHGNELAKVKPGDVVAVWGCGPVGLMALMLAKVRGASRIIAIDKVGYRLMVARDLLGAEIIDFSRMDVVKTIHQLIPGGPDVCIECAGFRFPKSFAHKLQRALCLESDTPESIREAVIAVKKGGRIALIGDYFGDSNNFPIGALMEKNIKLKGGQVFVQKYWKHLLGMIERGEFDPTFVITHCFPLERGVEAYKLFDNRLDGSLKVLLKPSHRA